MDEHLKALQFYRLMRDAVNTPGIVAVLVELGKDGELEMYVMPECDSDE